MRLLKPVFGSFNPEFLSDPYPQYRRLRTTAPIYFHPLFRNWCLKRYADVVEVLRDPRFSVKRAAVELPNLYKRVEQGLRWDSKRPVCSGPREARITPADSAACR